MKTILLKAALVFLLFACATGNAEPKDTLDSRYMPAEIKKALALKMQFPPQARELNIEGKVSACFYITPEGHLKVYGINGHPLLASYVKEKIESFACCPPDAGIVNKHMLVRFNFDIENL